MDIEEARSILREFNRRVDTAREHRTVTRLRAGSVTYELRAADDNSRWSMFTTNDGPDREAWDALILHLRFLIQDNEPTSLRNLKRVYDAALVPSYLQCQFNTARERLNQYLDSDSGIAFTDTGVRIHSPNDPGSVTYRLVFDTYVNGELAHRYMGHFEGESWVGDATKKDLFDFWESNPLRRIHADMLFNSALRNAIDCVFIVYDLNVVALNEVGNPALA